MRKKFSDMFVVMLTLVLMVVSAVVVSPMSVPVGVVDVDDKSDGFVAQSSVDWWPMFHHDPSHTGYSTSEGPNTNNTIWNYTTGGEMYDESPAIVDGKIYVPSYYHVYCLDAFNGDFIWRYTTGDYANSHPAVVDGKVYVGSNDDKVYCLNATTGFHIWNYTTGDNVLSAPVIVDGKVYVGSNDKKVYCLNASTGAFIWSYTTGHYVRCDSPAVADGKVYVGSDDAKVYCLNASTGVFIWSYTAFGKVWSSPAVADGKVYVGSAASLWGNKVYCLNATTGDPIWTYQANYSVGSCCAVAYGNVYVGISDGKVYCLPQNDPNSDEIIEPSEVIWSYETASYYDVYSPAVADGKVYVGSGWYHEGKLHCLNASSGAFIWSYTTGGPAYSPAVAKGKVYVGSDDYKVYCFGPPPPGDVAVTNVTPSKTVVGQGYSMSINVTVENQGDYTETFNVTTYYNGTIPNGDFEKDPTGTSFNDITNWNHSSKVVYGSGSFTEDLKIVDDYCFKGDKSLYSYIKSNTGGSFEVHASQLFWTENPVDTTADYISLWIGGDGYTTSSRYVWQIGLHLTDGTNTHFEKLRCDVWGNCEWGCCPNHCDYYNATETGADGNTWKRYTRRIPDSLDKSNLTITIKHRQGSWDGTQASSWYRLDSIYFSDSEGNPQGLIETKPVTNLPSGEETTLTFTWNTTDTAKGNYTIKAHITPLPGETDTTDNTLTDGWILVTIPGDVDGNGIVEIKDMVYIALAYGCTSGQLCYDPNLDVNCDGIIDIKDIVIAALHYGETW